MSGLHITHLLIAAILGASSPVVAGEGGGGGGGAEGVGSDNATVIPVPMPKRGGVTGSFRDPITNETRVVIREPNGATQIIDYAPDGTIIRQGNRPAPPARVRPAGLRPIYIGERQIGNYRVQTYSNPDGSASRITVDANGNEVGRTNFAAGDRANSVVADAQRGRR